MKPKLKPLAEQVVVVTGASSGIGLATARMAADRGAKLVLAARSEGALKSLVDEITGAGGRAVCVVADVGREQDVRAIAEKAVAEFGGFDTWVNDAGTGIYGRIEEVSVDDMRHLFETNFWSQVYGSRIAVEHLRARGGGALINVGSEVSERAVPLQGVYCATKHAVKGVTEALRMELEDEGAPISVTLVKPGQIDTPFPVNSKNYLSSEPKHVPPVYAPEAVARAILAAAEKPVRDVYVGAGARIMAGLGHLAPGLTDRIMEAFVIPGTPTGRAPRRTVDALDAPSEALEERGNYGGFVQPRSLYTDVALRPVAAAIVVAATTVALRALLRRAPHLPAHVGGHLGKTTAKALHIVMTAKPGREAEVETMIDDIGAEVEQEPKTRPWFGVRRGRRVFEIFETFPDEAGRLRHLTGKGAALLLKRSNRLLSRPAKIDRLDVIAAKPH